jgi:hypothetical protein
MTETSPPKPLSGRTLQRRSISPLLACGEQRPSPVGDAARTGMPMACATAIAERHTFGERSRLLSGNPPVALSHRAGVPPVEATAGEG